MKFNFDYNVLGQSNDDILLSQFFPPGVISKPQNTMTVIINFKEWQEHEHFMYVYGKRKTFLEPFTKMLSRRLRKKGVKCCLKRNYNYTTSATINAAKFYWKGLYTCIEPNCDLKYRMCIKNKPCGNDVELFVFWNGTWNHEEEVIPVRTAGKKRLLQARDIMLNGITNTKAQNILFNKNCTDVKGNFYEIQDNHINAIIFFKN